MVKQLRHIHLRPIALAVGLALVAAPAAQGNHQNVGSQGVRPDDRAGIHGIGSQPVVSDVLDRQLGNTRRLGVRPDDKAGPRGIGGTSRSEPALDNRPDNRAGLLGVGGPSGQARSYQEQIQRHLAHEDRVYGTASAGSAGSVRPDDRAGIRGPGPLEPVAISSGTGAFDWGDAGIGALSAFAIALLAFGLTLAMLRHRRSRVPAL